MLPANPRLGARVVVLVDGKRELVLGVILARQVSEDGVSLKHGEVVVVVVHNGRDAAVGVDGGKPGLLLDVLPDVDALPCVLEAVRLLELLEEDAGLEAVGRAPGEELDALFGDETSGTGHGVSVVLATGRH